MTKRYVTRDREAGNEIERFETLQEAKEAIRAYEDQDRADGTLTEGFYEIWDTEKKEEAES